MFNTYKQRKKNRDANIPRQFVSGKFFYRKFIFLVLFSAKNQ